MEETKWKNDLLELKKEYTDSQIAVLLGLSHSAVLGRLKKFQKSGYFDKIIEVKEKLNGGEDKRKIFFKEWCKRVVSNEYSLRFRAIRESLVLSNRSLLEINLMNPKNCRNLAGYETGRKIMPKCLYNRLVGNLVYNEEEVEKTVSFIKSQIRSFLDNNFDKICPSIVYLMPRTNTTEGFKSEHEVYKKIKEKYTNTFLGATFTNNFSKLDGIDILIIDNTDPIAIEVKSFSKTPRSTLNRHLKRVNSRLRRLRTDYSEIKKAICIVPTKTISNDMKLIFYKNGNMLLDKKDLSEIQNQGFDFCVSKSLNTKNFPINNWVDQYKLSASLLENPLKYMNYNKNVRNMKRSQYNIDKILPYLKEIENLIAKIGIRKVHLIANKYANFSDEYMVFYRAVRQFSGISLSRVSADLFGNPEHKNSIATLESGKRKRKVLKKKYIDYIVTNVNIENYRDKALNFIEKEKQRWLLAEEFPMVVGLTRFSTNELEIKLFDVVERNGYIVINNVLIDDKNLNKMTLNFHHPEADIVAKKGNDYFVISCKSMSDKDRSQKICDVEAEINKLSQWTSDIEFSKSILVISANLPENTWDTLTNYANSQGVKLWKIKSSTLSDLELLEYLYPQILGIQ